MSQPVWVLSVDLQAKTATFQTGMADAARSARTAFNQIGEAAEGSSERVVSATGDVRHTLGLLDNAIRGNHSAAFVDLFRMMRDTAFVMSALPFAGVIGGFLLVGGAVKELVQHISDLRAAQGLLNNSVLGLDQAEATAFNGLDRRIVQAEQRADELKNDHLAALQKQLQLIDMQSMDDLIRTFETVEKAADNVFGNLKSSWYEFGIGSAGAMYALTNFKAQYEDLLARGQDKQASDLLSGTLSSAEKTLAMMHQFKASQGNANTGFAGNVAAFEQAKSYIEERGLLSKVSEEFTREELESQEALVNVLNSQVVAEGKIAEIKKLDKGNARVAANNDESRDNEKHAKAVESYNRAVKRMMDEDDKEFIDGLEHREENAIEVTKAGSAERLAAINAAIREEQQYGRSNNEFYTKLQRERIETVRAMTEEQARLEQQAGQEAARHAQKMADLQAAAQKESAQSPRALVMMTGNDRVAAARTEAAQQYEAQRAGLQQQLAELDTYSAEYLNKKREINDRLLELDQEYANKQRALDNQADNQELGNLTAQQARLVTEFNSGFAQVILGKRSMAQMMQNLDSQMAQGMLENAMKSVEADDFTKERDAARAARKGFNAGMELPFPANLVAAPVLAAGAFAAVMAFERGTDRVPGVGRGDVVPSYLEPGEGVVPGGVMDGLRKMARSGGFDAARPHYQVTTHVHLNASALDSEGMETVLDKHADKIQRHFEGVIRKMNR